MKIRVRELHRRSFAKAVSYRVLNIIVDSFVAYFFTRDISLSASIVIFVETYSTVLYYLHERVWAHVHWGRRPVEQNGHFTTKN